MLDKSHLELVENVLKETDFNTIYDNKDWYKLGQKLEGVNDKALDYIKGGSVFGYNYLKLKECLRRWLSSGFASPPTLADLAAALKSIGYSEAGEYIIKTCKLIIMFNDQCY